MAGVWSMRRVAARTGGGFGRLPFRVSRRTLLRLAFAAVMMLGAAQAASAAWIPAKAMLAQLLLERSFEQSVMRGAPVKPWGWADTAPVARVSVPRLGQQAVVLSGGSGEALAFGPTELPTQRGDALRILAAHRDTHFAFMADLQEQDIVQLEGLDGELTSYRVTRFATVRWDEFAVPRDLAGEWLVLSTCWPFDAAEASPLRRVAWARKVGARKVG